MAPSFKSTEDNELEIFKSEMREYLSLVPEIDKDSLPIVYTENSIKLKKEIESKGFMIKGLCINKIAPNLYRAHIMRMHYAYACLYSSSDGKKLYSIEEAIIAAFQFLLKDMEKNPELYS